MGIIEHIAKEQNCESFIADARQISTFKGGGKAWVFMPQSTEKLVQLVRVLYSEKVPFYMLGKGSNTLVNDGVCRSVLISTKALDKVKICGDFAQCECGASVANVISAGRKNGLGGLEFLSGVPCSIGGAAKMNAGAFGAQIGDYIYKMHILNLDCANCGTIEMQEICRDDLHFSYRQGACGIVLDVVLKLPQKPMDKSINEAMRYLSFRRKKQPSLPSLGSVFKNGKIPSGKLIENCSLKGEKKGGARVSDVHANFIVNEGGASAGDYLYLASLCKRRVYESTGVLLDEEFVTIR